MLLRLKKNETAKVAEVETETENGRLTIVIPRSLKNLLKPKQRLWTPRVRRMVDRQLAHTPYFPATELLNDYLRRDGSSAFSVMNVYEVLQQDGEAREAEDQQYMASVFAETDWINKNGIVTDLKKVPESIRLPQASEEDKKYIQSKVEEARQSFNEGRPEEEQLKYANVIDALEYLPKDYVFVMDDSILIPRQKDHRNVNGITDTIRDTKYVSLANATVICAEGTFAFTAVKEEEVMKKVLAFLIDNNLLENRGLAFFADGATTLKKLTKKYFGFRDYEYYLDWYHLWKKCYEYFSMALYGGKKNRERNNKIRYEFFKRLWAGNIEEAVAYLRSLDEKIIKSQYMLEAIISYISDESKKRDQIYGYALRKELGLVNSSNRIEKQNDIDLAERCKDCASSWTDNGALHMAQMRLLFYQKQDRATADRQGWYQTRQLSYRPVPLSEDLRKKMWIAA